MTMFAKLGTALAGTSLLLLVVLPAAITLCLVPLSIVAVLFETLDDTGQMVWLAISCLLTVGWVALMARLVFMRKAFMLSTLLSLAMYLASPALSEPGAAALLGFAGFWLAMSLIAYVIVALVAHLRTRNKPWIGAAVNGIGLALFLALIVVAQDIEWPEGDPVDTGLELVGYILSPLETPVELLWEVTDDLISNQEKGGIGSN